MPLHEKEKKKHSIIANAVNEHYNLLNETTCLGDGIKLVASTETFEKFLREN